MVTPTQFSVCGETLSSPMHICGFFDSKDQQYEIILPYIMEGLENNDKVINILEGAHHREHCDCLTKSGISIAKNLATEQLEVLASENTYIEGGRFAAKRMYNVGEHADLSFIGWLR